MTQTRPAAGLFALGVLCAGPAAAVDVTAELTFGIRSHPEDGRYAGQPGAGAQFFVGTEIAAAARAGAGDLSFRFAARADTAGARDLFNLKEAHYTQSFGSWDLLAGVDIRPWGVAESRSVLNVLNPRDETDPVQGGGVLGTPMLNANIHTGFGTLGAYALLGFVPPNLPAAATRQRAPWPAAPDRALYDEGDGRHVDIALRWSHSLTLGSGGLDLAASFFDGTSRSPVSLPGCAAPTGPVTDAACDALNTAILDLYADGTLDPQQDLSDLLDTLPADDADTLLDTLSGLPGAGIVPYYPHIRQAGFSAVYAAGDLQLRAEAAHTAPRRLDSYWSGVVGGDYSFHGIGPTGGTVTLVAEYLWDTRDTGALAATFENDVFLGLNLLLNDRRDTRFQAGGFHDLDTGAQLYQISASTRLNDSLRVELSAFGVRADNRDDPLWFIDRDGYVEFRLTSYF